MKFLHVSSFLQFTLIFLFKNKRNVPIIFSLFKTKVTVQMPKNIKIYTIKEIKKNLLNEWKKSIIN